MQGKSDAAKQISEATQKMGKTYSFQEDHDKNLPAQTWFQESDEGLIFFIVFYTQACRWSKCLGCNLPSTCSQFHVDYQSIISQIDNVFNDPEVTARKKEIKKIIISNNGSVLDEDTFSSTALMYLLAMINIHFSNLTTLCIETRPEYTDMAELEFLSRALKEGETPTKLEVAIGFEAFDEKIRNEVFNKGLSLDIFDSFVSKVSNYGFGLKCYFMQKPVPGISDDESVQDIMNGIDYLDEMSKKYNVKINMHLNPTYVAYGTLLEESFNKGEYTPPVLRDVAKAAKHGRGKSISIFVGLFDEGLAVPGGSFLREGDEALAEKLDSFNRTQNYDILD